MKLDPKINSVHDILTPFDTKEATDHIGEYCAFTDDIEDFKDLNLVRYGEFKRVEENRDYPFEYELTVSHLIVTAKFCLPYARLKKEYRPFTLNEFLVKFPMLTNITMREKGDNDCIITCAVTAYRTRVMSADICLGVEWISLKELMDKYEYKNTLLGMWTPFGVKE